MYVLVIRYIYIYIYIYIYSFESGPIIYVGCKEELAHCKLSVAFTANVLKESSLKFKCVCMFIMSS